MIFNIWINENQDTLRKPGAPSVYIYIYIYIFIYLFIYIYTYHYIIISPFKTVKGHKCRLDPRCSCWNHRNFYSQLLRVKSPKLYPHCIPIHHHYSLFKIQFLCSSFNRRIPIFDAQINDPNVWCFNPNWCLNSLVNVYIAMEHHHFSWVNPLFRLGHFQ